VTATTALKLLQCQLSREIWLFLIRVSASVKRSAYTFDSRDLRYEAFAKITNPNVERNRGGGIPEVLVQQSIRSHHRP